MHKESRGLISTKDQINKAINSFSGKQMFLFLLFSLAFVVSIFLILDKVNQNYLVERPISGGSFVEGVIGSPRFINPVLASSNTDRDLSRIIFSTLVKKDVDGQIVVDLAESFTQSEDGLVYTFTLKDGIYFHNGSEMNADDVLFTIQKIQDGKLKSPMAGSWQTVSLTKIDEKTIEFKLNSPYTSFLENLSNVGILPSSLWSLVDLDDFTFSNLNIEAIGSGPYKISKINKKRNGPIESIELRAFTRYHGGAPFINKITFKFYKNEEEIIGALKKRRVDQINSISGFSARNLEELEYTIENINLSRIFGIFFNSNKQEFFRNTNVKKAIDLSIDKERIVRDVLGGYGEIIDGPIPKKMFQRNDTEENIKNTEEKRAEAIGILERDGWTLGEDGVRSKNNQKLSFSISTGDAKELGDAVEIIQENLKEVGIEVEIKIFEIGNLNQSIIRPREYEALFFGQVISNESDLFAFWHSSQRNDPGLNIASYTNSRTDGLLERIISSKNEEDKNRLFTDFENEIKKDMPAVFIYSPDFIYVTNKKIQNIFLDKINTSDQRLTHVNKWFTRTEKVWNFIK